MQSRHALWVESGLRVGRQVEILSAKFVEKQKRPGYYFDGAGLYLQVSPTKSKSWILRYTRFQKTREMGLGSLQAVSLAEARDTARQYRKLLTEGKDPIEVRDAKRQRRGSRVPPRSALPGAIAQAGGTLSTSSDGKTPWRATPDQSSATFQCRMWTPPACCWGFSSFYNIPSASSSSALWMRPECSELRHAAWAYRNARDDYHAGEQDARGVGGGVAAALGL